MGQPSSRYIREIIFGKCRATQFWEITTDPQTLLKNSTWYVMTHAPEIKYHQVGNLYGLRNWLEYGLKQSKNELGWADFRVTDYAQIQKWWEVVMSAYLLVSLHSASLNPRPDFPGDDKPSVVVKKFSLHPWWDEGTGWKNLLNNLRLVLQPFVLFNLIRPRLVSLSHSGSIFGIFTIARAYELLSWCSSHTSSNERVPIFCCLE